MILKLKEELLELKARQNRYKNISFASTLVDDLENRRDKLKRMLSLYENNKVLNLTESIIEMINGKTVYHIETDKSYTWSLERHNVKEEDLYLMKKDGYIIKE